jgi:hypothetical protein
LNLNLTHILEKKQELENHPLLVTNIVQTKTDLQIFMQNHVFAVWDFMSLAKSLQNTIAPSAGPWVPTRYTRSNLARQINEIILAEESDSDNSGGYICHFDVYRQAMFELGANLTSIDNFVETVSYKGVSYALNNSNISVAAKNFVTSTFEFIDTNKPHVIAAAFAFGRESVIPSMFRSITTQLHLSSLAAPKLFYYLNRHIEIDGDDHGPAAINMISELCDNDPIKFCEAESAAISAINHRIKFWDEVEKMIYLN